MADERVVNAADVERVRKSDGCFQRAQLIDLHQSQRFPESVQHKRSAGQLGEKGVFGAGQDDGYAGLPVAFRLREMAYAHAGHIAQIVFRAAFYAGAGAQRFDIHGILQKIWG